MVCLLYCAAMCVKAFGGCPLCALTLQQVPLSTRRHLLVCACWFSNDGGFCTRGMRLYDAGSSREFRQHLPVQPLLFRLLSPLVGCFGYPFGWRGVSNRACTQRQKGYCYIGKH